MVKVCVGVEARKLYTVTWMAPVAAGHNRPPQHSSTSIVRALICLLRKLSPFACSIVKLNPVLHGTILRQENRPRLGKVSHNGNQSLEQAFAATPVAALG